MKKDTSEQSVEQSEVRLSLEELIRRGPRDIIQRAIEVEVQQLLAEYENVWMLGGSRAVVRNGYLPAREVLTAVGNVEVRVPKVRDRSGAGVKFNSALVPPYVRRSARVSAEHWIHLRTTNPIESTFATVRHRTTRTKNCVSRSSFLGLAFKLVQEAEKSWRRIRGVERIAELMGGVVFKDGEPVKEQGQEQQRLAA